MRAEALVRNLGRFSRFLQLAALESGGISHFRGIAQELGVPHTIVAGEDHWLPVEVKWSEAPTARDARHLQTFLSEYPKAREGIVVCRTPRRFRIFPQVTAVPWQEIPDLVASLA